jgi:hypothetical protein
MRRVWLLLATCVQAAAGTFWGGAVRDATWDGTNQSLSHVPEGVINTTYTGIVMATSFARNYQSMADMTLPNKERYCKKHGYPLLVTTKFSVDLDLYNIGGLVKCFHLRDAFHRFPNSSWVYIVDTDHVITNLDIMLESFTDDAFHFVACADLNAPNAGSFFVRNSELGKAFLNTMCASIPLYKTHAWFENELILELWKFTYFKTIMKVLPQRNFNSYPSVTTDLLGTDGLWQRGDFMLHFAGTDYGFRMREIPKYLPEPNSSLPPV